MTLTKLAIRNLAAVLDQMDVGLDIPVELDTIMQTGRPYVVVGHERLVLDDAGLWALH